MKKFYKFCFIIFFIIFLCNIRNVNAQVIDLKLKRIEDFALTKQHNKYDSAQSMTVTDKYIIVVLADSTNSDRSNLVYVYDKNNYKLLKNVYMTSCAHANGITYNSDMDTLVCADNTHARFVIYDAKDFDNVKSGGYVNATKIIKNNQKYNNIAYDSDHNKYWIALHPDGYKAENLDLLSFSDSKDNNIVKDAENARLFKNLESYDVRYTPDQNETGNIDKSERKYWINQDVVYKDGFLYLMSHVIEKKGNKKGNIGYFRQFKTDVKDSDAFIFTYDVKTGKKGNILYYSAPDKTKESIRELEDIAFDGEKAYFMFQNGGKFQVYTIDLGKTTSTSANVTMNTKVNNNTSNLLINSGMKAKFKSVSSTLGINKSVDLKCDTKKCYYSLNVSNLKKLGKYDVKVLQENKILSGWSFDDSTLTSSIKVKYDLNKNSLKSVVSYKDGKNTFNNKYSYPKINVPIVVSTSISSPSNISYNLNLNGTMYKDNNKVKTVKASNGKYTFNNLSFNTPGTYNYTIKQENSGTKKDGIYTSTIDGSTISFKVVVSTNGDKLTYKIVYNDKKSFSNKIVVNYNTIKTNYSINITTLKTNNNVSTPVTNLKIMKGNSIVKTIKSNNNKYSFDLSFSSPGTYKYSLVQNTNVSGLSNVIYNIDKSEVYLDVVVKVSGNKLVASSKLSKGMFTNKISVNYSEISVPIKVKINSSVTGNIDVPETVALISGNGISKNVTSNNGYYNYSLKTNSPGTYTYKIKQKNLNNSDFESSIDSSTIIATVTVTSNNNVLNYSVSYSKSTFNNSYVVYDPVNISMIANINTNKNDDSVNDAITTADLRDSNNNIIKSAESQNGKYVFSNIQLSEEGNYQYTIIQRQQTINLGSNISYVIDDSVISVNVNVYRNNSQLKAKITYNKNNESDNSFNNNINVTYSNITINPTFVIDNTISDGAVKDINLSASIYLNNNKISTVNESNNSYVFNLNFDTPGIYEYIVKQDNSGTFKNGDNISTIDTDSKKFVVTVKSTNAILSATTKYEYDNDLSFSNYFTKKEKVLSVPLQIGINNKKLNPNAKVISTTAVLSTINENGSDETIEKVNSNEGKYVFNSIEIVSEGTYVYKVSQEKAGKKVNGKYISDISKNVIDIIIKVKKDKNNNFTYNIENNDEVFENTYDIVYEPIKVPLQINIPNIQNFDKIKNKVIISDGSKVVDSIKINNSNLVSNKVELNKVGEYIYNIYQTKPYNYVLDGNSFAIDSKAIVAKVNVVADENDNLQYSVSYDNSNTASFDDNSSATDDLKSTIVNIPFDININSNSGKIDSLGVEATIYENDSPIETVSNNSGSYSFNDINISEVGKYTYTIKQSPIESDDWVIDDSVLTVNVDAYNDDFGNIQYNIEYENDVSSFTNDSLVDVYSYGDEIITDVPDTSLFINKYTVIISIILVISGVYIINKNIKKNKSDSNVSL